MGPQIRGDRPDLAAAMGADHPVLRLRSGRAQNRLHHECYRGLERQAATGGAGKRPFPERTRRQPSSFSWSCARSLSNGKCRLANGPRQRPSSPSCSAIASSELDGNPAPRTRFRTLPEGTLIYFASKRDCEACVLKPTCCPNAPARKIARSVHEAARDKARAIAKTEAYAVSRRQRKKVEMLFAHLKRILRLDRLRLRGPSGAKDEFLLAATAQNLRKLAKIIPLPAPVFVT
jgi:Transposase DDE domain